MKKFLIGILLISGLQGCAIYVESNSIDAQYTQPIKTNVSQEVFYPVAYAKGWSAAIKAVEVMNLPISDLNIDTGEIEVTNYYNANEQVGLILTGSEVWVEMLTTDKMVPTSARGSANREIVRNTGKIVETKTEEVGRAERLSNYRIEVVYHINVKKTQEGVVVGVSTSMKGLELVAGVQPLPVSTGLLEKDFIKHLNSLL